MIGYLEGNVISSDGSELILKVASGIGYQIFYKDSVTAGKHIQVYVTSIYREDGQILFGFPNLSDKKFFELLLKVKGVGPKTAYNLMTHLGIDQISLAIQTDSKNILTKVPGVGAKAAAQIILDLSGKVDLSDLKSNKKEKVKDDLPAMNNQIFQDAVMALKELGYKESEFSQIVVDKMKANEYLKPENLLQDVLRSL